MILTWLVSSCFDDLIPLRFEEDYKYKIHNTWGKNCTNNFHFEAVFIPVYVFPSTALSLNVLNFSNSDTSTSGRHKGESDSHKGCWGIIYKIDVRQTLTVQRTISTRRVSVGLPYMTGVTSRCVVVLIIKHCGPVSAVYYIFKET